MAGPPPPPPPELRPPRSAASRSEFVQLRVPQDEHEALAMLTFWTRNAVEQAAKTLADGWSAEQVLAYATTDIKNVLSYIDRMSQQESEPTHPGMDNTQQFQEGQRVRHRYADLAGRVLYDTGGSYVKVGWDHYALAISALGMQADLQRRDMLEPEEAEANG